MVDLKQRRFEYHDSLYEREGDLSLAPSSRWSLFSRVDHNRDRALFALRHLVQKEIGAGTADWPVIIPEGPVRSDLSILTKEISSILLGQR